MGKLGILGGGGMEGEYETFWGRWMEWVIGMW